MRGLQHSGGQPSESIGLARMKFTVFGGTGFIGRHLVAHLRKNGRDVIVPPRDTEQMHGKSLGHVVYAIGMTGNFRNRPHETLQAHVYVLENLLKNTKFESWLYLSSTRVYAGLPVEGPVTEDDRLSV